MLNLKILSSKYKIIDTIGSNSLGGRTTYLGEELDTKEQIVIKHFSFSVGSVWDNYKRILREMQILMSLQIPNVPEYLDFLELDTGCALIYRYINGVPLSDIKLDLFQIHNCAIAILKILVELQSLSVPIFHRDIKPENIILGEDGSYYLIDFGFSSLDGGQSLSASSVVAGTMGFFPPEQLLRREVSTSSDLYSLGVTLFCAITKTKTQEVSKLIDSRYQLDISSIQNKVSRDWYLWLQRMVCNDPKERWENAAMSLSQLSTLDIKPNTVAKENPNELSCVKKHSNLSPSDSYQEEEGKKLVLSGTTMLFISCMFKIFSDFVLIDALSNILIFATYLHGLAGIICFVAFGIKYLQVTQFPGDP